MKDADNQEIKIGDRCSTCVNGNTDYLVIVQVIGFTPKKVRVRRNLKDRHEDLLKFPRQIAKVERQKK